MDTIRAVPRFEIGLDSIGDHGLQLANRFTLGSDAAGWNVISSMDGS
jgi:hypothetical protein